jgi:hypothetical protein
VRVQPDVVIALLKQVNEQEGSFATIDAISSAATTAMREARAASLNCIFPVSGWMMVPLTRLFRSGKLDIILIRNMGFP